MSPVRLIILLVAAAAAVGAALLVRDMSSQPSSEGQSSEPVVIEREVEVSSTKVLVSRGDMRVGSLLTPEDFEWSDWPEKALNAAYFTQEDNPGAVEDLSGSVVKSPLLAGEPVVAQKIVKKGETGFMAALLRPGMRAISVEISPETASAGFILPDDRVDVILTYEVEVITDRGPSDTTLTRTVLENARVLAIDQIFGEQDGMSVLTGSTATLELGPKQAELLAHASRLGRISLALRSVADADENDGATTGNTDLLNADGGSGNGVKVFKNGNIGGRS
ncbi:MAG: Flp pilus assembly protein CpaB [Henriciella sp.]|mgnify:CR=1 FL=1|uniref:Flp pilus assembly protein CpaB n=1 Tax=Henriciella sp. TaxID=1968823 RepID=UPI00261CAD8B|nr:Flp pilus assembly protein CpaB [Henriciella sp.]